jgi:hypothetical protein
MTIRLTYGTRQRFRHRYRDITIRGRVDGLNPPLRHALYRLNGGAETPVYVEAIPDLGIDWVAGYKASPAELRCRDLGEFCVEIPVDADDLRQGDNQLDLRIEDAAGRASTASLAFAWNPCPLPLPLDLRDLTRFDDIQEIGQVIKGAFDLDRRQNVIRSRAPGRA